MNQNQLKHFKLTCEQMISKCTTNGCTSYTNMESQFANDYVITRESSECFKALTMGPQAPAL